jgi:hypothetical protein
LEDVALARTSLRATGIILPLLLVLQIGAFDWQYVSRIAPTGAVSTTTQATPRQLAEVVLKAGVRPGDEIGFIGYAFGASFARLARIRITSELPSGEAQGYWTAPPETQEAILARFAQAGAVAVVTDELPPGPVPEGWTSVKGRRGFGYLLLGRTGETSVGAK